jgi:hypothetical protein
MLVLGMAVAWAGYGLASWGYELLKDQDITLAAWLNPVHPFDWADGDPGKIPDTQINPSAKPAKQPKAPVQAKAAG